MKSILIIGMSTFGQHLLMEFASHNCEVMIADINENVITPMLPYAVSAKIADCTLPEVLSTFGVDEFDYCFICLGGNFTESLEIAFQLKELGAKYIIAEVNRSIEKKFLLRNGADAVIYPEEDMAQRVARMRSSDSIFDAINLSDGYMIYEIATPASWIGKSLKQLRVREKFGVSIIAVKKNAHLVPAINPDEPFEKNEHLVVICHESDVNKLIKL